MLLVILKSSEDPDEDPYLQAVQANFPSINAVIVSPHEFRVTGPRKQELDLDNFHAVLFTSKRAVQFFQAAFPQRLPSSTCIYAVGPATAKAAAAVAGGFDQVRGGDLCGNAAALCDLVAKELRPGVHRLLFPCGRMRKNTIEARLGRDLGFSLTVAEVYCADEKESLAGELLTALKAPSQAAPEPPEAKHQVLLGFFSPSSVDMALQHFNRDEFNLKLISIGPSTSQKLKQLCPNLPLSECASPSVDSFLAAVARCL